MMDSSGSESSAQEIQQELSEIERDLTLRKLLWESQEEWEKLDKEWTQTPFDQLLVENLQKSVNRFSQTVFMLEKGAVNMHVAHSYNFGVCECCDTPLPVVGGFAGFCVDNSTYIRFYSLLQFATWMF